MRCEIIDIEEMTESRIILNSKPNGLSRSITYLVVTILLCAFVWSLFAEKEVTLKTNGVVTAVDEVENISSSIAGNVTKVNIKDGSIVKKGDVLLVINASEYILQKDNYEKSLEKKNKELDLLKRLKTSVLEGANKFDLNKEEEKDYFNRCKLYLDNINLESSTGGSSYKEQYLTTINTSIEELENTIFDIKMNLDLAKEKVDASSIKASSDGKINMISEINVGDFVQIGTTIASIVPENEEKAYKIETYISNDSLGKIKEGQDVSIELSALPASEYGYIKSNIENISVDAKTVSVSSNSKENKDQSSSVSFYTAQCPIKEFELENRKGEKIQIKYGMNAEVRIITRKLSYFKYFIEQMDIIN